MILTNFALPRHPIETEQVSFTLKDAKSASQAFIQQIDLENANAKRRWEQLGKPDYLSAAIVEELNVASQLRKEPLPVKNGDGAWSVNVAMPPQSVASIQFSF